MASAGWESFKPAELKSWNAADRSEYRSLPCSSTVETIAFSPDSKYLATGDRDGTVVLWDLATDQERSTLKEHTAKHYINGVTFSPDGTLLASASADGTVIIMDLSSPPVALTVPVIPE